MSRSIQPAESQSLRIVFINPNFTNRRSSDALEPLAFAILKALTLADVETVLYDERVEEIDFNIACDAVAISVQSFTARRAYEIARRFRVRGIPVILGGHHPTLLPEEAAEHCDVVATGEGEGVWPRIVDDLRGGSLRQRYTSEEHSTDVIPDRSLFQGKPYSMMKPVQFGRGCRYSCDFCSVSAFYHGRIHQRPLEEVLTEIETITSRFLLFVDDNILLNRSDTLRMIDALAGKNKKWVCQVSIDSAFDDELVRSMARAGCIAVFVGLESLNPANLDQIGKVSNLKYNDYPEAIRRFRDHGIMFCGSFLFGYDNDTVGTIESSCQFAISNRLCISHFNTLFPMPGTRLYQRLEDEKRLRYERWWLDPAFRYGEGMFHPSGMTAEELGETCHRARQRFNSPGNILYRFADLRSNARSVTNAGAFLAANLISRREIRRKQHMELGVG